VAGCSSGSSGSPDAASSSTSPGPAPSASATPTEDPTPSETPDAPDLPESTWAPEPEDAPEPTAAPELPEVEVASDEQAELGTGVEVELSAIRATTVEAQTPGEVSGPAVVVDVVVTNSTSEPVDVSSAVVTLESDGIAGAGTTAGSPSPLTGAVDSGDSAEGTYVFMLDPAADQEVTVTVNYAAGAPVAVFTGRTA
jgi:hypothetical protein